MSDSETAANPVAEPVRVRRPRAAAPRAAKRTGPDTGEFRTWLSELGMAALPTLHINGASYPHCVLVVDFGVPFKQPKLTAEQSAELGERLKTLTRLVMVREVSPRVSVDSHNGVWWVSVI